jgi:hypothetical protein
VSFRVAKNIANDTLQELVTNIYMKWRIIVYPVSKQGHSVAQLAETLRYKLEGRGCYSRLCPWNFHWHNPSGRTVALGSTQPLTEMGIRNIPRVKGGRWAGLTTLPHSCTDFLETWEPQLPGNSKPVQACRGIAILYLLLNTCLESEYVAFIKATYS